MKYADERALYHKQFILAQILVHAYYLSSKLKTEKYSVYGKNMISFICSYLFDNCYTFEPCKKAISFLCKANAHRTR
ncbi:hypothetical protein ABW04_27960 [Priestia megaterium]|nr:hypothetical protein ABW04_27960 [Priestia megaterium]